MNSLIYLSAFLIAIVIHEIGHVVALRCFGCKTKVVFAVSWNIPIAIKTEVDNSRTLITAAIAGPIASTLFGLAILPYDAILGGWIILLTGIVQILPLPGSDGKHILQTIRKENNV